jgi:gamma-D-glutamyl-L-lysine dipeptidyl-peptidase
MAYIIAIVGAVPMRADAAHRSEMVSQLLFGELALVLDTTRDFLRVRSVYDGYEGWCQTTQLATVPDFMATIVSKDLGGDYTNTVKVNGTEMLVPFGSSLGLFMHGKLKLDKYSFEYIGTPAVPNQALFIPDYIAHIAKTFLNAPYLWGGRSVFGIDCSGFTQQVFRFFNMVLPRDAYQQAAFGEVVGFLQEVICGDLAFFDNDEGRITHVGILLDSQYIIHASGKVRIDLIDNMGILNRDTGERTHKLRIVKRYKV